MKGIFFILLIVSAFSNTRAQEIRVGLDFGPNVYQKIELNRGIWSPENSYYTYVEYQTDQGLINKNAVLNGFHIGGAFNFSYKRFALNIEPQYHYQRTTIKFKRPYELRRVFGKKAFRMPIYFTFKIFKKENSLFLLAGLNFIKEKNWDIQDPGIDYFIGGDEAYSYNNDNSNFGSSEASLVDYGDEHFHQLLYDNLPYWNYMFGFGRTFGKWNASVRAQTKLDITKHQMEAKIWQIELSFNFLFLSTKDVSEKHFLYVD